MFPDESHSYEGALKVDSNRANLRSFLFDRDGVPWMLQIIKLRFVRQQYTML